MEFVVFKKIKNMKERNLIFLRKYALFYTTIGTRSLDMEVQQLDVTQSDG